MNFPIPELPDLPDYLRDNNPAYVHLLRRRREVVVALKRYKEIVTRFENELWALDNDISLLVRRLPDDPDEGVVDQILDDLDLVMQVRGMYTGLDPKEEDFDVPF